MEKPSENKIALIYCRVSSEKQAKEGHGLDSQEHRCREYARQKGYPVEEVFSDSFTGGGDFMKRPEMKRLLEHADKKAHRKYVVIIDDLSRFARDVPYHFKLREVFKSRQIELECVNFNFDDSPEGELFEGVVALQNQYHRKNNRRQVIQKQKAGLEMGRWAVGGSKIGYKRTVDPVLNKKTMVFNEHAPVVKEALEGFAYKRFLRQIDVARFLKQKGVFGKASAEKYMGTVRKMLEDVFYAGYIEYLAWEVSRRKGIHEPLIALEIFELNQKRLRGETQGKRVRLVHNPDFVLGGLVECPECATTLRYYWTRGRNKRYAYYECKTKGCSFKGRVAKRDVVEGEFQKIIAGYKPKAGLIEVATEMFDDTWTQELNEATAEDRMFIQEKVALEKELELLAKKVATAEEGSATQRQLSKIFDKQAQRVEQLERVVTQEVDYNIPYRTALRRVLGVLKKPLKMWLSASILQKQKLFFFFFDQRLSFAAGGGYRTAQLSPVLRLFERLDNSNSDNVEVGGIEPPSKKKSKSGLQA